MRNAAKAANAQQTIVQDDKSIKVAIKNAKGNYNYEAPLDGSEYKYKDMDGDDVVSTMKLSDDKQSFIETLIKGKDKKEYTLTRYMENNEMRIKIANTKGKFCIRIFKKTA